MEPGNSKAALKRTGTKPKGREEQEVGRLRQELDQSQRLVTSLRTEVEQKESIAALAVGLTKVGQGISAASWDGEIFLSTLALGNQKDTDRFSGI